MQKIISGNHEFELVDSVPYGGYLIWNIGKNMIDGYLPLCQLSGRQPFDGGREINQRTLKAIKVDGAQTILAAIGRGQGTIQEMETYIKRYKNSKVESTKCHVKKLEGALEVMRSIKGIEKLT